AHVLTADLTTRHAPDAVQPAQHFRELAGWHERRDGRPRGTFLIDLAVRGADETPDGLDDTGEPGHALLYVRELHVQAGVTDDAPAPVVSSALGYSGGRLRSRLDGTARHHGVQASALLAEPARRWSVDASVDEAEGCDTRQRNECKHQQGWAG